VFGFPSDLLPSGFPTKIQYTFLAEKRILSYEGQKQVAEKRLTLPLRHYKNLTVPETICYSLQPEHHMQELMKHVGLFGHGMYCTNVNYFVAIFVVLKWIPVLCCSVLKLHH
jgi:hypothetical protein